jgi:hypothetical protein
MDIVNPAGGCAEAKVPSHLAQIRYSYDDLIAFVATL